MAPSKRTLSIALGVNVILVLLYLAASNTEPQRETSPSLPLAAMVSTSNHNVASMEESSQRGDGSLQHITGNIHGGESVSIERSAAVRFNSSHPQGSTHCFHNKVMFQPTACSKAPEIISKALHVAAAANIPPKRWNIAHVGSRDGPYKIAEIIDAFGATEFGTPSLRNLYVAAADGKIDLKEKKKIMDFCGSCCECVASQDIRSVATEYNATLLYPAVPAEEKNPLMMVAPLPTEYFKKRKGSPTLVTLPPNDILKCPPPLLESIERELLRLGHLDVLTLDAWRCDFSVVKQLVLSNKIAPSFLQFTAVEDTLYEVLMKEMYDGGYSCYFLTTKPEHKKFRGMRQPLYPFAVYATGCWRGIYDGFKGGRYHLTCHKRTEGVLSSVMNAFSRMTHKGLHSGCMIPDRHGRLKDLFGR